MDITARLSDEDIIKIAQATKALIMGELKPEEGTLPIYLEDIAKEVGCSVATLKKKRIDKKIPKVAGFKRVAILPIYKQRLVA